MYTAEVKKTYEETLNEALLKANKHTLGISEIKELIEYGEIQWDDSPFNRGFLHGLKEALKRMEGKV